MTQRIAIVGDGQMGLVLARILADSGCAVGLWGPFPEHVSRLQRERHSPVHLPEMSLSESVEVSDDAAVVLGGSSMVISAIPTQYLRAVWSRIGSSLQAHACIASVSKGIEEESLKAPIEVIAEACHAAGGVVGPMVCVSGPTIAAELAQQKPATLVAASESEEAATRVQQLLSTSFLRVYTHDDVIGVEVAGATKNVIALAAGMIDGLQLGYNAKSALLARGLAEITRLGVAMGARAETFFGVAGVGDLATTCFCPMGRNRTCGERLGKGESLEHILASTPSVVEGVPTTRSVHALAKRDNIEMPITRAVHGILFENWTPSRAIASLMERELKAERVGE
ncbi:MAG: NAD(P)H-dependent glycerol-3-phosphate dehydrogenase [Phycisphaerales bacterium]